VLTEFRARLVAGQAEHLLLDRMLEHFKARGLVKPRGKQRTDSTYVLAAIHDLHLLELVGETLRATLDDLAAVVPDWLRVVVPSVWFTRYTRRIEEYRLPRSQQAREALALEIGADGLLLLAALDAPDAPAKACSVPTVRTLRDVWRVHYARNDDGQLRWRQVKELPPVAERMQSPHDPEAHFSMKRQLSWVGYKVHVTETCDDDTAHLITHVETCPAMQPDMRSTAGIHDSLAAKGLRCLSKELSGAGSGRVSDSAVVRVALGVEADVADRRPVADLARPPGGVGGAGFGIEVGTPSEEFALLSGVPGVRCDEPDRAMAVLGVVPADETGDPALRVVLAGEPRCRPVRPVLAGAEQGFGERVVVADPRPAVGGDDAEPLERGLHGSTLHRAAVVGVQHEGAGEAALGPDRLAHEIGGVLSAFALVDLPADDLAAEDVEDQVEIKEHAPDWTRHPGDVPAPDFAGTAGAVAGRR